jgi:alkylation response protein AidB-like acyl-CoA dehydrogenase
VEFPLRDPVGPDGQGLDAAELHLIEDIVARPANTTDAEGVARNTLLTLGQHGLFGQLAGDPARHREIGECLAGSDASTWFCWVQHFTPMRTVTQAPEGMQVQWLPRLQEGSAIAAVAFAHLRRRGSANPVATRTGSGWTLNGTLDWITSWDIADVVVVMAQDAERENVVQFLLPGGNAAQVLPGFQVGAPLDLFAMHGTHTRPAVLRDVNVVQDQVVAVLSTNQWHAEDAERTVHTNPAVFGVARGAIAELDALGHDRNDANMRSTVDAFVQECRSLRRTAYAMQDAGKGGEGGLEVRAAALDFLIRVTSTVVAARAGAVMVEPSSATRRVREAMFLQVQGQTADARAAALEYARRHAAERPNPTN